MAQAKSVRAALGVTLEDLETGVVARYEMTWILTEGEMSISIGSSIPHVRPVVIDSVEPDIVAHHWRLANSMRGLSDVVETARDRAPTPLPIGHHLS